MTFQTGSKAKRLDVRLLAVALLDSDGKLRKDRFERMVKAGKITDLRLRNNGSLISFQFQGRRIRLTTLINFLGLLAGEAGAAGGGENQTEIMTNLIEPNAALPDELQEAYTDSGFTSKDVQEILAQIREAQGHLPAPKPMAVKTAQQKPQIGFDL